MKKQYCVSVDVTMNGDVYIDAESEEDAAEIVRNIHFSPYALKNFHFLTSEIFQVEEVEEEPELVSMPVNEKAKEEYEKRFGIKLDSKED